MQQITGILTHWANIFGVEAGSTHNYNWYEQQRDYYVK